MSAVSPLLMVAAVVLTANHYLLDAIAGLIVAVAGLVISRGSFARPGWRAQPRAGRGPNSKHR